MSSEQVNSNGNKCPFCALVTYIYIDASDVNRPCINILNRYRICNYCPYSGHGSHLPEASKVPVSKIEMSIGLI